MSIEAMKQVLKAWDAYDGGTLDHPMAAAMEALRAAIEQAEEQEPVAWITKELMAEYIEAISTAIYRNQTGELTYIADKLRRGES
jgi:predicted DNA-binding transcriptional regulator YafY